MPYSEVQIKVATQRDSAITVLTTVMARLADDERLILEVSDPRTGERRTGMFLMPPKGESWVDAHA